MDGYEKEGADWRNGKWNTQLMQKMTQVFNLGDQVDGVPFTDGGSRERNTTQIQDSRLQVIETHCFYSLPICLRFTEKRGVIMGHKN